MLVYFRLGVSIDKKVHKPRNKAISKFNSWIENYWILYSLCYLWQKLNAQTNRNENATIISDSFYISCLFWYTYARSHTYMCTEWPGSRFILWKLETFAFNWICMSSCLHQYREAARLNNEFWTSVWSQQRWPPIPH